jgi:4-hydroxy-3-methylbut-2-en-1-yl diphosphate reductase
MKTFDIPEYYRSSIITPLKEYRRRRDKLKRDFTPTTLDFGPVRFLIARHFGFCYGVENAIEIAYKAIAENPGKRIFLLSEMIHNPDVNADLLSRGVRFLLDTRGRQLVPFRELTPADVVIIPAFGTTLETQRELAQIGLDVETYNTTCPFVEKVWNKANQIGKKDYTIVVHGKPTHEETRATFSHSKEAAPTVVVCDMAQAQRLALYIIGKRTSAEFYAEFAGQYSDGFDPARDLRRIGVVNQTTMLASDTQGIADYLKQVMIRHYGLTEGSASVEDYFANTRDTLCYATNDNQDATYALLTYPADLAIVAGGYNSSNTSHIVELCAEKLPTYFIESADKLLSDSLIRHFDLHTKQEIVTENYLPIGSATLSPVTMLLTCGASCPDAVVEGILTRVLSFFPAAKPIAEVMGEFV